MALPWSVMVLFAAGLLQVNGGIPALSSVCEVLEHRLSFRHKFVAVRGEWRVTEDGLLLKGTCPFQLKTDGYTWPSSISLEVWPQSPTVDPPPPDFTVDKESLQRIYEIARSVDISKNALLVTVVGRFDCRDRLGFFSRGNQGPIRNGYGHLASFPAELVVKTVRDPEIVPRHARGR